MRAFQISALIETAVGDERERGIIRSKPLTWEEIDQIAIDCLASPVCDGWNRNLARAIERAHGIGGSDE